MAHSDLNTPLGLCLAQSSGVAGAGPFQANPMGLRCTPHFSPPSRGTKGPCLHLPSAWGGVWDLGRLILTLWDRPPGVKKDYRYVR